MADFDHAERADVPPAFEADDIRATVDPDLVVDVEGFEGPLDLLLDLARRQKVDLRAISVLALADQYLAFVESARTLRLELAADYLVMAAWLAFLKSRLLLPSPPKTEDPGDAASLATALALRLARLQAIRGAAQRLSTMPQLGRDVFPRGVGDAQDGDTRPARLTGNLFDLLEAYAARRQRQAASHVTFAQRRVWTLTEARALLEGLVGQSGEWLDLQRYLLAYGVEPAMRRSALASVFSAALEMVREGRAALNQHAAFAPLMVRVATLAPDAAA